MVHLTRDFKKHTERDTSDKLLDKPVGNELRPICKIKFFVKRECIRESRNLRCGYSKKETETLLVYDLANT